MGTPTTWNIGGSRILDKNRTDLSLADDVGANRPLADPFVVAVSVYTSKGPINSAVHINWRNVTDVGTFTQLGSTGELIYTESTDLTNDGDLLIGERKCSAVGSYIWQNGKECTDGALPAYNLADEYYTEHQYAVDPANGHEGDDYEFELYDDTLGASLGTLGAQVHLSPVIEASITAGVGASETAAYNMEYHLGISAGVGSTDGDPVGGGEYQISLPSQPVNLREDTWSILGGYTVHQVNITAGLGLLGHHEKSSLVLNQTREEFNDADAGDDAVVEGTYNEKIYQYPYDTAYDSVRTLHSNSTGKWVVAFKPYSPSLPGSILANKINVGIMTADHTLESYVGDQSTGWAVYISDNGSTLDIYKRNGSVTVLAPDDTRPLVESDRIYMAVDLDAGKIWFGFRGAWLGTGADPETGAGAAYTNVSGTVFLAASCHYQTNDLWAAELISLPEDMDPSMMPSGFTPGWINTYVSTVDADLLPEEVGLGATAEGSIPEVFAEITGALGVSEYTYEGEGNQYLVDISGDLGQTDTLGTGGSFYNTGITGALGVGFVGGVEYNWEPTLDRYLDGRPGQVGAKFGFYPKAQVYGQSYFLYKPFASRVYFLTISGGAGPIEIPMVSFNTILRDGIPSTLTVNIAGDYMAAVLARIAGSLKIETGWIYRGEELAREPLITVPIEKYRVVGSGTSTSITLSGSATNTYPGTKTVTLTGIQYESMQQGRMRYRGQYNEELEPGDTVNAGSGQFVADEVALTVSIAANGIVSETIEVGEGVN